jgi:ABC-type Na+ efflux pump permease subunit
MALSTLFSDSKVANYVGSLLMIFPIMIFLQFIQMEGNYRLYLYCFFFIPVIPACSLFAKLSTKPIPIFAMGALIDLSWISSRVCWLFLFSSIPFWFLVYLYADAVMPNVYGV